MNSYKEHRRDPGGIRAGGCICRSQRPDLETFKAVPPNPALKDGKRYLVGMSERMSTQDGLDILLGCGGAPQEAWVAATFTSPALEWARTCWAAKDGPGERAR